MLMIPTPDMLHGVVVPMITPLTESGALDREALAALTERLIRSGVHGLFVMGSCGECTNLSRTLWREGTRTVLDACQDRIPVYCGAIFPGTLSVLDAAHEIEEMGGRLCVATPHFYLPCGHQDDVVRHYETLARETSLDVVVYGNVGTTHVQIAADTLLRLAQHPRLVAVKDTRPDFDGLVQDIQALRNTPMRIFSGGEGNFGASVLFGAHGNICGMANFVPELCVSLYEAALRKDVQTVVELQDKLTRLNRITGIGPNFVAGLKHFASRMKLCKAYTAPPYARLTRDQERLADALLAEELGI